MKFTWDCCCYKKIASLRRKIFAYIVHRIHWQVIFSVCPSGTHLELCSTFSIQLMLSVIKLFLLCILSGASICFQTEQQWTDDTNISVCPSQNRYTCIYLWWLKWHSTHKKTSNAKSRNVIHGLLVIKRNMT